MQTNKYQKIVINIKTEKPKLINIRKTIKSEIRKKGNQKLTQKNQKQKLKYKKEIEINNSKSGKRKIHDRELNEDQVKKITHNQHSEFRLENLNLKLKLE